MRSASNDDRHNLRGALIVGTALLLTVIASPNASAEPPPRAPVPTPANPNPALPPAPASPQPVGPVDINTSADPDSGEVLLELAGVYTAVQSSNSAQPRRPVCSWRPHAVFVDPNMRQGDTVFSVGESIRYRDMDTNEEVQGPGENVEVFARQICDGNATGVARWIPTAPAVNIEDVIAMAYDRAEATIPQPTSAINPAPEHGAPVNLGLWLAVEPPAPLTITASIGNVWASVTATLTTTSYDMGNGDIITCDGPGVTYPWGADTIEQGPCGYTYCCVDDLGTRSLTLSTTYDLRLVTSTGQDRQLESLTTERTVDYPVYEITTVGVPAG